MARRGIGRSGNQRYGCSYHSTFHNHSWDGDDRLRAVQQGGVTRFTAAYDGGGLRTGKWDAWTGQHDYSWGPGGVLHDSSQNTVYTPGLSQRQNGADRFVHSDWLGSTRYLSDGTGNQFPTGLRYDAFGQRSATQGPAHPTDFQFAGGYGYQTEYADGTEPGLGLQYLEQRYYDAATGRFISQDPIGFAGGANLYGYVGHNPVLAVDPSGQHILLFTGSELIILGDDFKEIARFPAYSGKPGASRLDQRRKFYGPLPEGRYVINPAHWQYRTDSRFKAIHTKNFRGRHMDWGQSRVEIVPVEVDMTGRTGGFFLHGGTNVGSAGCLDVGHHLNEVRRILEPHKHRHTLYVDYSSWKGGVPGGTWADFYRRPRRR